MRRDGFALVAALWLVVALSTVALSIGLRRRERGLVAIARVDRLHAAAAADAALAEANAYLVAVQEGAGTGSFAEPDPRTTDARGVDPWGFAEAASDTLRLGGALARIELHDLGARLNLNRATETQIRRLLLALRVDAGRAARIAAAVADWRDVDADRRNGGAERDRYVALGMPVLPADAEFSSVPELRHVLGVDDALFARVAPFLTVAGSGRVSIASAPPEVLMAFPGIGPEAATALLQLRRSSRRLGGIADLAPSLSAPARADLLAHLAQLIQALGPDSREVEAEATGWIDGSPHRVVERAVFVRSGDVVYRLPGSAG